mmetsp:Transcript_32867/g.83202  ORF Transcript_32867/g.83202 Transcript_32867/m.83202 type:complete len:120 (+) Transcript_32867:122-481(+)
MRTSPQINNQQPSRNFNEETPHEPSALSESASASTLADLCCRKLLMPAAAKYPHGVNTDSISVISASLGPVKMLLRKKHSANALELWSMQFANAATESSGKKSAKIPFEVDSYTARPMP